MKKMTFGAIMARGNYYPFIELISGEWVKIEGYGQNAKTGKYWLQYAFFTAGGYGNVAGYKRIEDADPLMELTVVSAN